MSNSKSRRVPPATTPQFASKKALASLRARLTHSEEKIASQAEEIVRLANSLETAERRIDEVEANFDSKVVETAERLLSNQRDMASFEKNSGTQRSALGRIADERSLGWKLPGSFESRKK